MRDCGFWIVLNNSDCGFEIADFLGLRIGDFGLRIYGNPALAKIRNRQSEIRNSIKLIRFVYKY
jgi:hypothetical protein